MARVLVAPFKHTTGCHCESATLRDLLEHAGVPLSEAMVFGLDATLGFAYFDKVGGSATFKYTEFPIFLGGKSGTITSESMACKILGCTISMQEFKNADSAWESSRALLSMGTPLGIQVDMYHLPYFKERFHFGGHVSTLVGYDDEKGAALVCERDLPDVQEVPVGSLKLARGSKAGDKFMHPNHRQFAIVRRADGKKPPFARAAKLALRKVATSMIACSMNFQGIPGLKLLARHLPSWKDALRGDVVLEGTGNRVPAGLVTMQMLHGFIEEYGTGGGLFRKLYAEFIEELLAHDEIARGPMAWSQAEKDLLAGARDGIRAAGARWSELAAVFKDAMQAGGAGCVDAIDIPRAGAIVQDIIALEESSFKNLSRITP
nr:BtrH N-terminal domain-containing protein [Candidatus Sigynarchaeum springense]